LLAAIPEPDPRRALPRDLPRGEIPDAAVPPLGCAFHPRCPKAFAPCGWEGRDVRSLLEQRWIAVPEEQYERERDSIGDLTSLPAAAGITKVPDGSRGTAAALLDLVMSDDPTEPFWRGVEKIDYVAGNARITFREPVEPELLDIGEVRVACHLHDPRFTPRA
jgi:hypothetical protein